jgi:hypothetical protein
LLRKIEAWNFQVDNVPEHISGRSIRAVLNPDLDLQVLTSTYRKDDRVRIANFLRPEIATELLDCLVEIPFAFTCHRRGLNVVIPRSDMLALPELQRRELLADLHAAASQGIGFLYGGYRIDPAQRQSAGPKIEPVYDLLNYLNSPEILNFVSQISGMDDLRFADGQATSYTPGQFLTRHRDRVDGEERRLAYVLGFTREWHPDWGGLLQFYDDDGSPRDAWAPRFNSLALFDVRHVHSVTYVAPYARKQRLSLTGWFQAAENKR